MAAIGEDALDEGVGRSRCVRQRSRPIAVPQACRTDAKREQSPVHSIQRATLAPDDPLGAMVASWTVAFVRLGGLLAVHSGGRGRRSAPRTLAIDRDEPMAEPLEQPSFRNRRNRSHTVLAGGTWIGSMRHGQPERGTDRIAFTASRIGHARGRPVRAGGGSMGSISPHSPSVSSLAYRSLVRLCSARLGSRGWRPHRSTP